MRAISSVRLARYSDLARVMDITDEHVTRFATDGFVILERVLDATQVETVRASMDRVLRGEYTGDRRPPALRAAPHPILGDDKTTRWVLNGRLVDEPLWQVVTTPALARTAARLLGTPSVSVLEDQLLDKPPGGAPVATHQDYRYWQFSTSTQLLTAWIALDDVTIDNGTVQVVPGSHRWGEYKFTSSLAEDFKNLVDGGPVYMRVADALRPPQAEMKFVPVIVPAGGAVLFHSLTIHSSTGNTTDSRRRALSVHYAAQECTVDLTKTVDHPFPYTFARLRDGDRFDNKYFPRVFP